MQSSVRWSAQVETYVRSKAPGPRRELWQGIKALGDWDGREDLARLRHLEDELIGYSRLRIREHRIIFREAFQDGQRRILCLYAGPRQSVYEAFEELLLDDLSSERPPGQTATSKPGSGPSPSIS